MREIYIKSKAGLLPIGRKGENLATRVIYPVVPEEGQSVTVFVKRNGDSVAYPASEVEVTDTNVIWTVTSVDTDKQGRGQVQYRFSDIRTGEVIKTDIYGFIIGMAIDTEVGPAPDPYETWLDSLTELAGQVQADAERAEASAESAEASATSAAESATVAQEALAGAETAQAGAESAAQTAQAGADTVGLLKEQIYNAYPNVEAETGPIVSISDGADGIPVKSLVIGINPAQDLHGYDNPWPAGGGKNLIPYPYKSGDGKINTVTFSTNADGTIHAQGTNKSNTNALFWLYNSDSIPSWLVGGEVYGIRPNSVSGKYRMEAILYGSPNFVLTGDEAPKALPADLSVYTHFGIFVRVYNRAVLDDDIQPIFFKGSTVQPFSPYSNICPISGWTGAIISHSGEDTTNLTTYSITFPTEAGIVYGGSLDVTAGVLTVTKGLIASYAGEELPGAWISDRDVYAEGATPTTGAQVVYELATPITYQLTPTEVQTLLGANNIWADTGDTSLTYRADTKLYIDGVFEDYQDDLAD